VSAGPVARSKPPARAVLVFVREPVAGRVKTRLAAEVGPVAALRVYRALAEQAVAAARDSGAEVRVHCTPPDEDARRRVAAWLGGGVAYLPQAPGGLGERMRAAFAEAFAAGHARVVVIGSDLPEMSPAVLAEAFAALETHPAVVGPALDGGYYLLGMREMVDGVFDGIDWSTPAVLAQTLARFRAAGVEPARLAVRRDVDRAADLPPEWRHLLEDGGAST
jgi:uncharacterized protein